MEDPQQLDYNVNLPDFEGPLDLLLHLVKKHELEIFDIPISFITAKYLAMLDTMRQLNIDVAGEYLVMAATLMHIKSRELLPKDVVAQQGDDAGEDDIDPRQALIKRLLEYQKYKDVAAFLGQRPVVGRNVWARGAEPMQVVGGDIDVRGPLQEIPVFGLIECLEQILSRSRVKLTHDVTIDRLSLADKINELQERLEKEESFTFESCFAFLAQADAVIGLRGQVVITFLAILEMAKLRLLRIYQAQLNGSIYITRPGAPPPARPEAADAPEAPPEIAEADSKDQSREDEPGA